MAQVLTLHEVILQVLAEHGGPLAPRDIARRINDRALYVREDGGPLPSGQVSARVNKYPVFFVDGGLVHRRLPTSDGSISIRVPAAPPAKDGAKSIFSPDHPHHPLVQALRESVRIAMVGRTPFESTALRMEVIYERGSGQADALNLMNGIADVLQRRPVADQYANDAWAIDDDANIREVRYQERKAVADTYEVVISAIPTHVLRVEATRTSENYFRLDVVRDDKKIGEYERSIEAEVARKTREVELSAALLCDVFDRHGAFVVRWNGNTRSKEVRAGGTTVAIIPKDCWQRPGR